MVQFQLVFQPSWIEVKVRLPHHCSLQLFHWADGHLMDSFICWSCTVFIPAQGQITLEKVGGWQHFCANIRLIVLSNLIMMGWIVCFFLSQLSRSSSRSGSVRNVWRAWFAYAVWQGCIVTWHWFVSHCDCWFKSVMFACFPWWTSHLIPLDKCSQFW